jgi:Swi5-dependent recombination DNA repair protein 1
MGGPKVFKDMQKRQLEFQAGFDEVPPHNEDEDSGDENEAGSQPEVEKRDLYAEYDVEPETENERQARRGNIMDEFEGQDDVSCFTVGLSYRRLVHEKS